MKKFIAVVMAAVLATGVLAGCGASTTKTTEATTEATTETTTEATTEAVKNLEGTLVEIIEEIYKVSPVEIMLDNREIDIKDANAVKYNTGLDNADKISGAAVSEAMIGAQAYSLAMVRLKDAADAKDVAEAMKAGIDTRKWICVAADDLQVVAYGDVVMLIMVDTQLSVKADDLVAAFKTVCGGDFSVELK